MVAVVTNESGRNSIAKRFRSHPRILGSDRQLIIIRHSQQHEKFLADPPAQVFHVPQPINTEYAWARHHVADHAFALSGLTHTICTGRVMERFVGLVTAPLEAYDTLFCISRASVQVIRSVTDNYAAYLRERHGGNPGVRARLEHVPLGIDTTRFQPAEPEARAQVRLELGIDPDALCVLFVGRLSYFAKVHPFPMFRAVADASRRTGRKVHLVLAGWAEDGTHLKHFERGAQAFAGGVPTSIVDGTTAQYRHRIWQAADIFTSMTDNIQETLSQTILEAQACGLPVVATDWDGCRDEVEHGVTGFLVPARTVSGATANATSRLLLGEVTYSEFLAVANQAVAVDVSSATDAFARLFEDASLRTRMGAAGRDRILNAFTWDSVVQRYEKVWCEQDALRRSIAESAPRPRTYATPVPFPELESSFASYPSEVLGATQHVQASQGASDRIGALLEEPITNYMRVERVSDPILLAHILDLASVPRALAAIDELLASAGVSAKRSRATVAWMLKYDLLSVNAEITSRP